MPNTSLLLTRDIYHYRQLGMMCSDYNGESLFLFFFFFRKKKKKKKETDSSYNRYSKIVAVSCMDARIGKILT